MSELTAARLRELLHYDPETGLFHWLQRAQGRSLTRPAGGKSRQGYITVMVEGSVHQAHRLAWLYVHGAWPEAVVDHINGDPSDNRIANLRDVEQSTNMQNQSRPQAHNKTGFLGVSYDKSTWGEKKYRAIITVGGRFHRLGRFMTPEEAHAAYLSAKRELHAGCTI